jgi:hypothetical protein
MKLEKKWNYSNFNAGTYAVGCSGEVVLQRVPLTARSDHEMLQLKKGCGGNRRQELKAIASHVSGSLKQIEEITI